MDQRERREKRFHICGLLLKYGQQRRWPQSRVESGRRAPQQSGIRPHGAPCGDGDRGSLKKATSLKPQVLILPFIDLSLHPFWRSCESVYFFERSPDIVLIRRYPGQGNGSTNRPWRW